MRKLILTSLLLLCIFNDSFAQSFGRGGQANFKGGAITLGIRMENSIWLSGRNNANNADINMFRVNTSDGIDVGAQLNVGAMSFPEDAGAVTALDMPVSAAPADETPESYTFKIDGTSILTVYAEANSAGGIKNEGVQVNGGVNFGVEAQANDDYEVSLANIASLSAGLTVTFIANTANTDGATLEISEVGDLDAILKLSDQALATGDIEAGQVVVCVFDGTNWQMTSQLAQ